MKFWADLFFTAVGGGVTGWGLRESILIWHQRPVVVYTGGHWHAQRDMRRHRAHRS